MKLFDSDAQIHTMYWVGRSEEHVDIACPKTITMDFCSSDRALAEERMADAVQSDGITRELFKIRLVSEVFAEEDDVLVKYDRTPAQKQALPPYNNARGTF